MPDESADTEESSAERANRELIELLNELRVALPGVQILFAFLLVLPFQQQFPETTPFQEKVYFVTLLATAMASIMLIGPSARHRLRFRHGDKAYVVFTANRLAIAGFGFLAVAILGAILLVSDFLFGTAVAAASTAAVGLTLAWCWFASPLGRDLHER